MSWRQGTDGRRVVVTGGAGFIGSHLCRALLERGWEVRVVDNFSGSRKETLRDLGRTSESLDVREGDIRNLPALRKLVQGADALVHLAGVPQIPLSVRDPALSHAVNLEGTFNALNAAREAKVKRFVYGSSAAIYGDRPEPIKHEVLRPRPRSPLAVQVLAAEHYCRMFAELYGLGTVCLRYFNVYGPGQDARGEHPAVIPQLIVRALRGEAPVLDGDGKQARDFVYVDNVVEATIAALDQDAAVGRVINVGSGTSISIADLWTLIVSVAQKSGAIAKPPAAPPRHGPPRLGDMRHLQAATSRLRAILACSAKVSLVEGLGRTIESLRKQGAAKSGSYPRAMPTSTPGSAQTPLPTSATLRVVKPTTSSPPPAPPTAAAARGGNRRGGS